MKILKAFFVLCLVSQLLYAEKQDHESIHTLIQRSEVQIEAKSNGGLGASNLLLKIKNAVNRVLKIHIPSGTHFKSENEKAQDLIIAEDQYLTLQAGESKEFAYQGYCTQRNNYSPGQGELYVYNGLATGNLGELCDIIKYPFLEGRRQGLIWTITDNAAYYNRTYYAKDSFELDIYGRLSDFLNRTKNLDIAIKKYDKEAHGFIDLNERVFSFRGFMCFRVPVDTRATFQTLNKDGDIIHTYFKEGRLNAGLKFYEFGINDIVKDGEDPEYTVRVTNAKGELLAEEKVKENTVLEKKDTQSKNVTVSFEMKQYAAPFYINIYDAKGELYQVFKRYKSIKPGFYTFNINLEYFGDANQKFEVRLEDSKRTKFYSKWTE